MPPKPHKAKQRRATAASKKDSKKGSTALHKSALSIPERVVLKNMDRRYRSGSSSSSSSSSSEFEAPQPPRRVRQPPVKLPPTPPPAVAKPPVPRARTVAAKKAHAPTVKKLPEKRNGRRGGSGDERTLRMGHRDQWIMPPQQATLPARRVLLKRDRRRESPDDCNLMSPPAPRPGATNGHDQRPVDVLKTLFLKTCTKEGFLRMAIATVTPSHAFRRQTSGRHSGASHTWARAGLDWFGDARRSMGPWLRSSRVPSASTAPRRSKTASPFFARWL